MDPISAVVIAQILELGADLPLAIIGSANLYLQGITVPVADIDFMTSNEGVVHFAQHLGGFPTSERGFAEFWIETDGGTVNFTSYEGNALRKPITQVRIARVAFKGLQIPCLSLEEELAFYRNSGREKDVVKVALIEKALKP